MIHRPAIPFSYPGIAEDITRLHKLIKETLHLTKWNIPTECRILNLACGRADETGVLRQALLPFATTTDYLGIDLRHAEITEAKKRWPSSTLHRTNFLVGDASLATWHGNKEKAHLVFIRHQNFWDAPAAWEKIYRHALHALEENGILIITSYFDHEHALALACLKSLSANLLLDIPHPASRVLLEKPLKTVDRRIAVFSRSEI